MKPSETVTVSADYIKRLQERNEKLEKMAFHYTPEEWNTMMRTIERLKNQLKEANEIIEDMRPFIQGSMKRETFTRILRYEDKWGVE